MPSRARRIALWMMLCVALCGAAAVAGAAWFLDSRGIPPRALAPYLAKRSSGHNPLIEAAGRWMQRTLLSLDRGYAYLPDTRLMDYRPGAARLAAAAPALRALAVSDGGQLRQAIAAALPGDVITLLPGSYLLSGGALEVNRPGTAEHPIVVRAEQAGSVTIGLDLSEGFKVSAPYWTFENLSIRGVCLRQMFCEHAFHVVGGGHHFTSLNNQVVDFNSHFKINEQGRRFPDHGSIIGNTITNTSARRTDTSVTLVDLVAASHWTIRANLITDFAKDGSDRISYGAFAKGAGSHNVFEQNIVVCEHLLRAPGQRVGLSLGGGGTGKQYCRDSKCITEQDDSVIRANLIASCSDEGIYLNSAARSTVAHNTVLDTAGIVVRYAESSAELEGNLVDGAIRSRDGGVLRQSDNRVTPIAALYVGYHPVRDMFAGASVASLAWSGKPPRRDAPSALAAPDLCGAARPLHAAYGAFEELPACRP